MLSKHLGKIFDYRRGIEWHKTIPRLHDPKDRNLPNYEKRWIAKSGINAQKQRINKGYPEWGRMKENYANPKHEICYYREKKWNSRKSQNFPQWVPQKWASNRNYKQQRHPHMPMSTQNI